MRISRIYQLFERAGHEGGPVVTLHLPQRLAEDLLRVLHEAVEVAGGELPGGEEEDELGGDEDGLGDDMDELPFGDEEEGDLGDQDDLLPAGVLDDEDEDDDGDEDDEPDDEEQQMAEDGEEMDEKYLGFNKLKDKLARQEGKVRDPAALAAAIGRKKYGKAKFQAAAAKGKKLG